MQNAKDTFYAALRDRLAASFPEMTVVVRGLTRPAIVVEENELVFSEALTDAFVLRWVGCDVNAALPMAMETMRCEIRYATAGSAEFAGVDRGRKVATMDAALSEVLMPHTTVKKNYTVTPAVAMETNIYWSDAVFGDVSVHGEQLERVATVSVTAYREAGE